ncbi:alpha-amylase family glycosyl hydrolase [Streptomyces sp. NPDC059096]|uniref:alpha-amylase family glycosyl hydrolase n=1 Tax=Streptomyces sp. NPDC059096 TaxID=3346727 RepID=UPI0036ADAF23
MTQHLTAPLSGTSDDAPGHPTGWWRDAVIYQVYPRSFADGNGDGMGDLDGVRRRLPYLRELGVDAVWLSPFYASPQADAGYDVADYRAIDPMFGTLLDADALIHDAHALGLRVIVDLVPNHSSDAHDWFRRALREGPGSPLRERYHFRPGKGAHGELPPNDWESVFGGAAWTRTTDPDGTPFFDQDGVHAIYRQWRTILDEYPGERIAVAEAWTPTVERTAHYVRPDELHQAFNFQYLATSWESAALREVIDVSLAAMRPVGAPATWVLSNHDVTRHATRFAGPPGVGTQTREPGDRTLGLRRARAATLLMLALPGSAYVYQGEELGLPDVTDLPDEARQDPSYFRAEGQDGFRDGCRVPIPWTREGGSYGFGAGGSWLPQPEQWGELSVEAQTGDPGSTLELYRAALSVRKEHPGLGGGTEVEWRDAPEGVLIFARPGFVCTVNTTGTAVRIPAPGAPLLSSAPVTAEENAPGAEFELPADTTVWWSV